MNKQELRYNKYYEIASKEPEKSVEYIIELEDRMMDLLSKTEQQLILSSQADNPEYPRNGSTLMERSHGRKGWLCIACIANV